MSRTDWEIIIEDLAARVAEKYGIASVAWVFQEHNATWFDNLHPCYYWDVYGNLMQMDADD